MKYLLMAILALGALQVRADEVSQTATSVQAVAPETTTSNIHLAPALSYTIMNLKGDHIPWTDDTGLSLGAYVELGKGFVTFETGLLYSDYQVKALAADINARLKLSYISVPVLAKFNFLPIGGLPGGAYVKAGILPSVLAGKVSSVTTLGLFGPDISFKKYDVPAVLALGYNIPFEKEKSILLEASYLRGLMNINHSSSSNTSISTEGLMISAAVNMAL